MRVLKVLSLLLFTLLMVTCNTDDDVQPQTEQWLYAHTASQGIATSSTTFVMPVTDDIFGFTDRPYRKSKYISGDEFASYWNDYDDVNSFKLDPPNAVLTYVDGEEIKELEVVITDATFDGSNITYTIDNTSLTNNETFDDASLFVDTGGSTNPIYYTEKNGLITVKVSAGVEAGYTGNLNGWTYHVVDRAELIFAIEAGRDLSTVVTTLVTDMSGIFDGTNLNGDISSWDVSNVTNMSSMFNGASDFNQNISIWDVSNVTIMSYMFNGATAFNQDISSWDVSNVTNMRDMFNGATAFNQDISSWDVSNVTDMGGMFKNDLSFNQNIGSWDVSNVTDMSYMFNLAEDFNTPIGDWNVSNVTNMGGMFNEARSFNQDISSWDVSNVTDMSVMFDGAFVFNKPIGDWNVSNVTDMFYMFATTEVFNQDISSWDVSNVTRMGYMFYWVYAFNQDLSSWNVSGVTECNGFSEGSTTVYTKPKPNFTNCNPN